MRLAAIQSLDTIASCTPYISSTQPNTIKRGPLNKQEVGVLETFATDYGFKIGSDLTGEQRQELLQLLFDYKDVFARSLSEIKRYKHYEHDIHLSHDRKKNFSTQLSFFTGRCGNSRTTNKGNVTDRGN